MGFQVVDEGLAQRLANGTTVLSIAAVDAALDISDRASMRRTTFSASGEIDTGAFPYALRRVLAPMSASAQNGRSRIRRM